MISFGQGVELSTIDLKHMDRLRRWRNHPEIYRWCRQNDLITETHHAKWFEAQSKDPSTKMYLITTTKMDDETLPIGVCGFTSFDPLNRRAEFSLYIDPALHGAGYGRRALSTLISHGFKNLGLNSIWGETFDGNPAARMFESLGFRKEGTRRQFYFRGGKMIDAHLYSILAQEWVG